ncbi:MAG: hypothetical protein HS115_18735 [Spirochaetales bacterium]|nr:hypothetical protein [Spirochaetales bacterium]
MGDLIRFWGVRNSIPAPISASRYKERLLKAIEELHGSWSSAEVTSEAALRLLPPALTDLVGGETACAEIRLGDVHLICDAGTGARPLGYDLMVRKISGDVHLFLSGLDWCYIQGWPFFIPGYIPSNTVHFYSAELNLEEGMVRQQNLEHFPVTFTDPGHARKVFHRAASEWTLGKGKLKVKSLPNGSQCLLLSSNNRSIGYWMNCAGMELMSLAPFFQKADFLCLGFPPRGDWTSFGEDALAFARGTGAGHLLLTHFPPALTDEEISGLEEHLRSRAGGLSFSLVREGKEYGFS